LNSNLQLKSSATINSLIWSSLDVDGEYFRIVSNENNKWLKALGDGNLMLASTSNTGLQTRWRNLYTTQGYYLLNNKKDNTYLGVEDVTNALINDQNTNNTNWSLPSIS